MADEILVDEKIQSGTTFLREFSESYPVAVAFWVVLAESLRPVLYVASDTLNGRIKSSAYGKLMAACKNIPPLWLDPFQIKLLAASEPLAQAVMRIRESHPANLPIKYNTSFLGGLEIERVYIYPTQLAATVTP